MIEALRILAMIARRQRGLDLLRTMQTQYLLDLRRTVYRTNGGRNPEMMGLDWEQDDNNGCNIPDYGPWVSLASIKAELAKRPHVPNKAERRAIRQNAAKHRSRT